MKRLLAKSYNVNEFPIEPPDYALLTQHSSDVAEACLALSECIGGMCLRNAAIEKFSERDLTIALKANGWLQDLGKANSHFQNMLKQPGFTQLLRHEVISGLLACNDPMRIWLQQLEEPLLVAAVWGAMGHHRKFESGVKPKNVGNLTVFTNHPDFGQILKGMQMDLSLTSPPSFAEELVFGLMCKNDSEISAGMALRDLEDEFSDRSESIGCELGRFIALVKALGVAADVAASAVAKGKQKAQYSISDYVEQSLKSIGLTEAQISQLITKRIWSKSGKCVQKHDDLPIGFQFRPFQLEIANSCSTITLATAGCGSGKSLAAYVWAKKWCADATKQGRTNFKLFFCLPTTGTTTEHFRDYALEAGFDASLTHSRSSIDLATISETAPQEEASDGCSAADAARAALRSSMEKIESLALWSTPLVVTTADTILGLMANSRKSICSMPAIMSSAIVFDEVHAFDKNMFGHLLVFLKNFPAIPVLLMTASLSEDRKRALLSVRPDLSLVNGPPDFEQLLRYQLEFPVNQASSLTLLKECVQNGGKILWIRNRVDWANNTFNECCAEFAPSADIFVYHSRFRYKDRSRRHRRVIDKFKEKGKSAILVSTQVAEMSLDLSADLLISDLSAVPALIQRMGRLNRMSSPNNPLPAKKALILDLAPGRELPYSVDELALARQWLNALIEKGSDLSQKDLADVFASIAPIGAFDIDAAEQRAIFFSGLWETRTGKTRDEGYTISVLLERDVRQLRLIGKDPTRDWIRQHEVSIPYKNQVSSWEKQSYLPVAPTDSVQYDYNDITDEGTGAAWL